MARAVIVDLSIMTVIGVILALLGPFGSYEKPLELRLIYWVGLALAGYACYSPISALVVHFGKRIDLPETGLWVAAVLIATAPMTAIAWSLGFVGRDFMMPRLDQAFQAYLSVLVIGAGVTVLFHILDRKPKLRRSDAGTQRSPTPAAAPPDDTETSVRFIDRLPPELGTSLIALEMEDHYVRAHTTLGSELLLMRMRDAMLELDGLAGEQVHRSWWVARDAVTGVKRDGRNVRLELEGGLEAPVARARLAELKQAGWL